MTRKKAGSHMSWAHITTKLQSNRRPYLIATVVKREKKEVILIPVSFWFNLGWILIKAFVGYLPKRRAYSPLLMFLNYPYTLSILTGEVPSNLLFMLG